MLGKFVDQKAQERYFAAYAAILRKWPVPAEELDIETRFGSTRVRRSGTGQGPPIVLLPGIMGTSVSWYPYVAELAAQHQVYAVDPLGEAGHSIQTRPLETNDDLADWLADVLTGLGHDKVHLVGLSRGGFLALNLAIRSSDRLASVIAFEPAGFAWIGTRFILWSVIEMFRWLLPVPILRRIGTGDPDVRHTFRPLLFAGLRYRAQLPPQQLFTDDELRAIEVTTQLILAERSNIHRSREVAARVEPLNPHIHTEIVPRTNHLLTLQKPDLVTARILELAQKTPQTHQNEQTTESA
jgi:pimeloyl-ACP methyl ester carboxylesterase